MSDHYAEALGHNGELLAQWVVFPDGTVRHWHYSSYDGSVLIEKSSHPRDPAWPREVLDNLQATAEAAASRVPQGFVEEIDALSRAAVTPWEKP